MSFEREEQLVEIRKRGDAYEITLNKEDDTLGNLLASYLEEMDEVQLAYYKRPHPLEERVIVYVKLKDGDIKNIIEKAINRILADIEDLRRKYKEALVKMGVHLED